MNRIIADRRALHRIPELDRDLKRTMEYLEGALKGLRCELYSPIPGSLCAWFDNGADSAIAFRSDADALPTTEAGCTLKDVVLAAKALLRFSGRFACCWPAARLQEAMTALSRYSFSVKRLRPVCAKPDRGPYLCLIEAVFGGRPGLAFEPPLLVMDQEGRYTDEIRDIYGDNGKETMI